MPILMMTAVNRHFPLNFSNANKDPMWLPIAEFLDKPVEPQVLVQKVKELVQRAQQASA